MGAKVQDNAAFAQVYVESVTIRNFRGINEMTLELHRSLTLLVGRNNTGKSRVLRALALALGGRRAEADDLTVDGPTTAEIDVVIAPALTDENGSQRFQDPLRGRLGSIQTISDVPELERFAWRTSIRGGSKEGLGVNADRTVLYRDVQSEVWIGSSDQFGELTNLVAVAMVETQRDLADEIARRGSAIRRVLDDLEIAEADRSELELDLRDLGTRIVASSKSLDSVKEALEAVHRSVSTIGSPSINPIPVRLEELARSVSIDLASGSSQPLPMRLHGAGARSLASLQVQGVFYDRRTGLDGPAPRPHPVSLIEEPEAHLHPQAQFELAPLLEGIPGQKVVSTHSSHLASVVHPSSIRILGVIGQPVALGPVDSGRGSDASGSNQLFYLEDMEKLRRLVERPFGELLFAAAVVIGDGACERALFPPLLKSALGDRSSGVCVVDCGGLGQTPTVEAIIKFCRIAGLECLLYADADKQGRKDVKRLSPVALAKSRIVWNHRNANGLSDAGKVEGMATEKVLLEFDAELCSQVATAFGYDPDGQQTLLSFLKAKKGVLGSSLAQALIHKYPWCGPVQDNWVWPQPIHRLIAELDAVLPGGSNA